VSVIPKVIYDLLNHDSLVPTSLHLQLVDQSIRHLVGIVEDIPVRIRSSFVPVDFVVLEMDVCRQIPLILGRPFLSTTEATIDVDSRMSPDLLRGTGKSIGGDLDVDDEGCEQHRFELVQSLHHGSVGYQPV
jgi:hypothetical protein